MILVMMIFTVNCYTVINCLVLTSFSLDTMSLVLRQYGITNGFSSRSVLLIGYQITILSFKTIFRYMLGNFVVHT